MFFWKNPSLTRLEGIARWWSIAITAIVVATCLVNRFVFRGKWYEFAAVGWLVLLLPGAAITSYLKSRARKMILAGQISVCASCGYGLDGLPDSGTCPECGVEYTPDSLRRLWAARYEVKDIVTDTPSTPSPPSPHTPPAASTPPPGASTS